MNRVTLRKNIVKGLIAGILCTDKLSAATSKQDNDKKNDGFLAKIERTGGNITEKEYTEDELLLELTSEGAALYNSLDAEGKKAALEIASQACNGTNSCKGRNACATNKNSCMGKGQCKGQSKCNIGDKNLAVKLAAKEMERKRQGIQEKAGKNLDK